MYIIKYITLKILAVLLILQIKLSVIVFSKLSVREEEV